MTDVMELPAEERVVICKGELAQIVDNRIADIRAFENRICLNVSDETRFQPLWAQVTQKVSEFGGEQGMAGHNSSSMLQVTYIFK